MALGFQAIACHISIVTYMSQSRLNLFLWDCSLRYRNILYVFSELLWGKQSTQRWANRFACRKHSCSIRHQKGRNVPVRFQLSMSNLQDCQFIASGSSIRRKDSQKDRTKQRPKSYKESNRRLWTHGHVGFTLNHVPTTEKQYFAELPSWCLDDPSKTLVS